MKNIIIIVLIGWAFQGMSQSTGEVSKEKMKELAFMEGQWKGGGWNINQDRTRSEFSQSEDVAYELNGTVLLIKGKGVDQDGKLVHNALGVVSYNAAEGNYIMHAFLENGMRTEAQLEIIAPGKAKWWFEPGNGATIRYTFSVVDGTWTETGEYSPDKETWYPSLSFSVEKQ